jgi:hypothetical protein
LWEPSRTLAGEIRWKLLTFETCCSARGPKLSPDKAMADDDLVAAASTIHPRYPGDVSDMVSFICRAEGNVYVAR